QYVPHALEAAAGGHAHPLAAREPEGAPQRPPEHPAARGMEALEIDAVVEHADALGRHVVIGGNLVAHALGDGEHPPVGTGREGARLEPADGAVVRPAPASPEPRGP